MLLLSFQPRVASDVISLVERDERYFMQDQYAFA
jgi:hypothetical protein